MWKVQDKDEHRQIPGRNIQAKAADKTAKFDHEKRWGQIDAKRESDKSPPVAATAPLFSEPGFRPLRRKESQDSQAK